MQSPPEDIDTSEELYEHFSITVDAGQQLLRLDKFLHSKLSSKSRTRIQNAIAIGNITVNGNPAKASYLVKPHDAIKLLLPHPPQLLELRPQNIPINIVYEDEDILIINKEAGMVVHPGYGHYSGTLLNAILYHLSKQGEATPKLERCGLVHRIDKNTTGLLLITKNERAMASLAKQFFDHSIVRAYRALVWGTPPPIHAPLQAYIRRNSKNRKIMEVSADQEQGKQIGTHYTVLRDFHYVSLLELHLQTGRTHQIRAHMNFLGHPIFGDTAYGGANIVKGPNTRQYKSFVVNCLSQTQEQLLHAQTLGFIHPSTQKYMEFTSELPQNFIALLLAWENFLGKN